MKFKVLNTISRHRYFFLSLATSLNIYTSIYNGAIKHLVVFSNWELMDKLPRHVLIVDYREARGLHVPPQGHFLQDSRDKLELERICLSYDRQMCIDHGGVLMRITFSVKLHLRGGLIFSRFREFQISVERGWGSKTLCIPVVRRLVVGIVG